MTDFSRFDNNKKAKAPENRKPRKPIRWSKIVRTLVWTAIIAFPFTMIYLDEKELIPEDTFKFKFGFDIKINSKPSAPEVQAEDMALTFEKLLAHYNTREHLTTIQFMEQDAKLKGEKVVYFVTVTDITAHWGTFTVEYDEGFVWDENWDSSAGATDFEDTPENRDKLRLWNKGTRLRFECVYGQALDTLAMQPFWDSCDITEM